MRAQLPQNNFNIENDQKLGTPYNFRVHTAQLLNARQQLLTQAVKTRNMIEPGLYFDLDQEFNLKSGIQTAQNQRTKTSQQNATFINSEKFTKLFSPHEYVQYASRVGTSKESYINSLQQLGFDNAPILQIKSLNQIMNRTSQIINKSYSVKYIGIIENNMGILSRRVKLSGFNKNNSPGKEKIEEDLQQSKQLPLKPQPQQFNNYIINKYSLPKSLKALKKQKDNDQQVHKYNLDAYHSQKLVGIVSNNMVYEESQMKKQVVHSRQQKKIRLKAWKKPINNYEENEEGICYAIIDTPLNKELQSYSRLLNKVGSGNKKDKGKSLDQLRKNIEYTQNEQFFDRIQKFKVQPEETN